MAGSSVWAKYFSEKKSDYAGCVDTRDPGGPINLVNELIRSYEIATKSKFVAVWGSSKTFGKGTNDALEAHKRVCWKDRGNDGEYSDVPMIHVGAMQFECHQGKDHDVKRKEKRREEKEKKKNEHDYTNKKERLLIKDTKKLDCPAKIHLSHILLLPDFRVSIQTDRQRREKSKQLQKCLAQRNFQDLAVIHRVEVQLPDPLSGHVGHDVGDECTTQHKKYNRTLPSFFRDRPQQFVMHMKRRWKDSLVYEMKHIGVAAPGMFEVQSEEHGLSVYHSVKFGDIETLPSCTCGDWIRYNLPCEHFCAVFRLFDNWQWEQLSPMYVESPFFQLYTVSDSDSNMVSSIQPVTANSVALNVLEQGSCTIEDEPLKVDDDCGKDQYLTLSGKRKWADKELKNGRIQVRDVLSELRHISFSIRDHGEMQKLHIALYEVLQQFKDKSKELPPLPGGPAHKKFCFKKSAAVKKSTAITKKYKNPPSRRYGIQKSPFVSQHGEIAGMMKTMKNVHVDESCKTNSVENELKRKVNTEHENQSSVKQERVDQQAPAPTSRTWVSNRPADANLNAEDPSLHSSIGLLPSQTIDPLDMYL